MHKQKYKTFRYEDQESFEQAAEKLRYLLDHWLTVENVNPDDARIVKEYFIKDVLINLSSPALIAYTKERDAETLMQWTRVAYQYESVHGPQTVISKGSEVKHCI